MIIRRKDFLFSTVIFLLLITSLTGCKRGGPLKSLFEGTSPREKYERNLQESGLGNSMLAQKWAQAGQSAFADSLTIEIPYYEQAIFPAGQPEAYGYRLQLKTGQLFRVSWNTFSDSAFVVFCDLHQLEDGKWEQVAFAEEGTTSLEYEVSRTATYLLRLQPELLAEGRLELQIEGLASLNFPVAGKNSMAVQSFWGAPRDGGSRSHQGVDIFAARGTPVVAAAPGRISRTGITKLGGKVVWLADAQRRASYYYAHLDSQLVTPGRQVNIGDTLGLVGNTGNARYTPPHLHFGIYRRGGAVDPYPFIHTFSKPNLKLKGDSTLTGRWMKITAQKANIRSGPSTKNNITTTLDRGSVARVVAISNEWYRLTFPDGTSGFVFHSLAGPASEGTGKRLSASTPIFLQPGSQPAFLADSLEAGTEIKPRGRFGNYNLVSTDNCPECWIPVTD